MASDLKSSGVQLPILLFTGGAILLVSAFKGQSIVDVISGTKTEPLNPAGADLSYSGASPVGINSSGAPSASGTASGPHNVTGGAIAGSPIAGMQPHPATHPTAGLPGYPAFDYMAPAGTPALAPVSGKVFKLSGKDPKLGGLPGGPMGYSIYIQGTNGKRYFLTHLDKVMVSVGQTVSQGQQIAVVAAGPASWSSPHVHMGVNG